jgi:hypothetical protein
MGDRSCESLTVPPPPRRSQFLQLSCETGAVNTHLSNEHWTHKLHKDLTNAHERPRIPIGRKMPRRNPRKVGRSRMLGRLPGGAQARALAKVGSSDVARLAWLLDLLNRPPETLATLSDQEFESVENEVALFCEPLGSIAGGKSGRLTVDSLMALNGAILVIVEALLDGTTGELQIPTVTLAMIPGSGCLYMGTPDALFRLAAAKLLEAEGHRIRRCARPGCGKLFAHRKRGLYCSRRCSQLVQFARYVQRHAGA